MYDLDQPIFTWAGALLPQQTEYTLMEHVSAMVITGLAGILLTTAFLVSI